MFVSQAHSFPQQARLAVTLAWVGGYTNIVTLLCCGTVTSHVSGTTSALGRELAEGRLGAALATGSLLAAFFVGAALSGLCTEVGRRRGWESIYVLPIAIETTALASCAALLFATRAPLLRGAPSVAMIGLAAAAMGLQNATITRISSGTVRTTHVTGVLTDLGHESVQLLSALLARREGETAASRLPGPAHASGRRLALLAAILITFGLGATLGALAVAHLARLAMFPPVAFLLWLLYLDVTRPIAGIEPDEHLRADAADLPRGLVVYRLRAREGRRAHRFPNLLAWSERLAPEARVVILDLAELGPLDANAALELGALAGRLSRVQRRLVLAGLGRERFHAIESMGGLSLAETDVCADLDLAIARGLDLLDEASRRGPG